MGLQAIRQNAQVQRITTALKNICRDYPAGGVVLRELLQNADDAGATEVRFMLDERTYPSDELIDPKLDKYQGPALLAYNNAVFTDKDFDSISRLGDSLKLNDGSTTGKFGRGFNSVYNWTNSPSIVSRERLYILDPHHEWSDGGPIYDFVENAEDNAMKNQMAAFQTVVEHLDQQLDGTVVRIPLRTHAQAAESEISNRVTTASEILEIFRSFGSEFGDSGLLFTRNVAKLEIGSAGNSIVIEMADGKMLRTHKSKVNDAVKRALVDPRHSFEYCFEAGIECRDNGKARKTTFIIHHSIQCGLVDNDLRDWVEDQKFIPWVAVAAQLSVQSTDAAKRSFFTVLPLPILTNQPVHVHGLFSIAPDRARLHQSSDKSIQDKNPARWNEWLLQGSIPLAWTKLLGHLADLYPDQPAFEKWPHSTDDARDPLSNALEQVIKTIEKESLALWPTAVGYHTTKDSLLYAEIASKTLIDALRHAEVPVVYVPARLQHRAKEIFKDRLLCPRNLCDFLKSRSAQIKLWNDQTKHKILEYLLSEPGFIDYGGLELFPFKDGNYRSIENYIAYVHRDKFEEALFNLQDSRNLDLEKLSETTQRALKDGCEFSSIHPSIRYRSASCLKQYCMSTTFKSVPEEQDMVILGDEPTEFVSNVWTWISMHGIDILDKDISCLWLFPLSNGRHRKVKPQGCSSQIYLAPVGEIGQLMWKFDTKSSLKPLPLLGLGPTQLSQSCKSMLMSTQNSQSHLSVEDASDIFTFIRWLRRMYSLVNEVADEEKLLIAKVIESGLPQPLFSFDCQTILEALDHLEIFQKVSWKNKGDNSEIVLMWTSLSSCTRSIGLLEGTTPIPEIDGVQFLIADRSNYSSQLFQKLKLTDCLKSIQIIEDHIIPAWKSGQASHWTYSCKEQVAAFIFRRFSFLSDDHQAQLRTIPIVPVMQLDGKDTSRFAIAADLIDPHASELMELCFDDEEILPKKSFFEKFAIALRGSGLMTTVNEAVVDRRIICYANSIHPLLEVEKRAKRLLTSTCRWTSLSNHLEDSDLRRLRWLPVVDLDGKLRLKASDECRGLTHQLLVDSQLPILDLTISLKWEAQLGWRNILPSHILQAQLGFGIQSKNRKIVDEVLTYICQYSLSESLTDELSNLSCVLTSSGSFVQPQLALQPPKLSSGSCEGLQPYLSNVDQKFWEDHKNLLIKLKVEEQLRPVHLLKVQKILEAKPILRDLDVEVAIEILRLASVFPRALLAGLKVITETRKFYPIYDVTYDDLGPLKSKEKFNLTHPDIPRRTIQKLGIDSLRERLIKGMLEIEDVDDEDEFDQHESVTTRIADTLDRYPVETTYREYLANSDDVKGASKISWLLDQRMHPCEKLLTPEMKRFQGPALLVHNDGIFSENDFKGFKNVGEGSKGRDRETIGQFGRGSQTMYHWTDVPIILSGKYLLILDPQQEVLPKNQIKGKRKPGVKLELSKLREACRDQLVPFENLWGYTESLDNYPGTIFRFPLRNDKTKTSLRTSKKLLDGNEVCRLMDVYFDEARISLLFLRRIRSIDFSVHGNSDSGWSVTRRPPLDEEALSFSELVICSVEKNLGLGTQIKGNDQWWVAIEDLLPTTEHLLDSSRRVMKNVECGLAALISSTVKTPDSNSTTPEAIQSRMFNTLPLPISSDLPVHIHATFLLSGDRQSIAVDEYGAQSHGSEWNRSLLQNFLPKLYFSFLDDIGTKVQQRVFEFFPQQPPPKRSCSELLCASFWEKLPQSTQRIFPKALPTPERSQRRAARLFDIRQAVFDFLPKTQSETLAPLLMALDVNLVRFIPKEVTKHLKAVPEVQCVTGSMLRNLLKSDKSRLCLLEEMAKNPSIFEVLLCLTIPISTELENLDGCHLLPLADSSLATLRFVDANDSISVEYYVATKKELELFEFASTCLVTSSTGTKLGQVLKSGRFNVAKLQLCHVKILLKLRPQVLTPNPAADKWLTDFWKFWNSSLSSSNVDADADAFTFKIFRATCDGVDTYSTRAELDLFPGVIEPSIQEHQQLCAKIPGLFRFDPKFMPKSLMEEERSFHRPISFSRFIRALRLKAGQDGVKSFVEKHMDQAHLKILRTLVTSHVSNQTLNFESKHFPGLSATLKSIPLWPSFQSSITDPMISASDALMAASDSLLVPWMKERHRFVDPQFLTDDMNRDCLEKLGVKKLSIGVLLNNYILPLPSTLSDTYWQHLQPLILELSCLSSDDAPSSLFSFLKQSKIAADGNRKLRTADNLYDHEDQMFTSAFRQQRQSKFLHESMRAYRSFWLNVGLRHRVQTNIDPKDYLKCLKELDVRLSAANLHTDLYLDQDSRTILSPLTAASSATQWFDTNQWESISHEKVFRSRTVFNGEYEYRRDAMALVATDKRVLSLSEVISYDHVAVCWSQTPFAIHQPTKEVLSRFSGRGKPQVDMVWRHLQHMKDVAQQLKTYQVRDYLIDLNLTYEYLQDHLHKSAAVFNFKHSPVWLNLNTLDHNAVILNDIKSSWHRIDELVLSSSCDAGPIKAVRPGLMRYEKLLRALGCNSIVYPTVTRPVLLSGYSLLDSLRKMRSEGKLMDITYCTDGKRIQAHRVVLAAASEKCAGQFSKGWGVDDVINYDTDEGPEIYLSYHALSTMINYAYGDEIDWKEMEVLDSDDADKRAEKLDMLLDLCKGADFWIIPALKSQVEDRILAAGKKFINLENVVDVQERADEVGAKAVREMCAQFIWQNQDAVDKAHSPNEA